MRFLHVWTWTVTTFGHEKILCTTYETSCEAHQPCAAYIKRLRHANLSQNYSFRLLTISLCRLNRHYLLPTLLSRWDTFENTHFDNIAIRTPSVLLLIKMQGRETIWIDILTRSERAMTATGESILFFRFFIQWWSVTMEDWNINVCLELIANRTFISFI